MRYRLIIAALFSLGLLLAGCVSSSVNSQTCATTRPGHVPADGRNLAPELQEIFGQDPLWPGDLNRGGGGGAVR